MYTSVLIVLIDNHDIVHFTQLDQLYSEAIVIISIIKLTVSVLSLGCKGVKTSG